MLYQSLILESFKAIGKTPREGQVECCNQILVEFLDNGKRNVIFDAPTGTGKTVIGAVTSECIGALRAHNKTNAIFLSSTNILLDQYIESFPSDPRFLTMKGAENYICNLKSNGPQKVMANNCVRRTKFYAQEDQGFAKSVCESCDFAYTRRMKNVSRNIITNYAYYFLDRLFIAKHDAHRQTPVAFQKRNIIVWDEAHLINDSFVNHCVIYFSKDRADEYMADCEKYFSSSVSKWFSKVKLILDDIAAVRVTEDNIADTLEPLSQFYAFMRDGFEELAAASNNFTSYQQMYKLYEKYEGLFCKINNYVDYGFEVVVDLGEKNNELKVSPIFLKGMFDAVNNAEFNLFMSATVSKSFLVETLGLEDSGVAMVRASNPFNISDKRIVISKDLLMPLNYNVLKEDSTFRSIAGKISKIAAVHSMESGLIFAPSFGFIKRLVPFLQVPHQVVVHDKGSLVDVLKEFKSNSVVPKILISPSIYEGVDLPGDLSRFQILTKAPYVSLADKRVGYILKHYPDIYQMMTIMRMIQGLGRSTRFKGDKCSTYFLDSNLRRLFGDWQNIWQDQFLIASSM